MEESDDPEDQPGPVRTQFLRDDSQSVLTYNKSPDMPFEVGLNPYRGCEHGCAYCFARPTHEYLGMSAGVDFESKIVVKANASELLRKELLKKSWKPQCITMSGVTDCYQPVERRLELTRRWEPGCAGRIFCESDQSALHACEKAGGIFRKYSGTFHQRVPGALRSDGIV